MTKALLIAALALVSTNAFASKARKAAISNSVTAATDVQDVWSNAAKIHGFGDLMTFEFGATPTDITAGTWENQAIPEGGIFKSQGDSKWGFYVGHRSTALDLAKYVTGMTLTTTAYTPMAFFYGKKSGDMSWAAGFSYYSAKKTVGTAETKNDGMGLRLGATTDKWEAYANLGLSAKETVSTTDEFKGNASFQIGGRYDLGDMLVYLETLSASGTRTVSSTDVKGTFTQTYVGLERKLKSEGSHVFYGAKYYMSKLNNDQTGASETVVESTTLPLYFGFEADVASWLAFRGEVSKAFFVDTAKNKTGGTETKNEGMGGATVSFGSSFKFAKSTLDWKASWAGNGNLTAAGFGTNASYTYNF